MQNEQAHKDNYARDEMIAVSRRLAQSMGASQGAGPEYLLAGACKLLKPSKAATCLNAAGLGDWTDALKDIPGASAAELKSLPKLQPEARLAKLLQGDLKALLHGTMPPDEVAKKMLADQATRLAFVALLEQLARRRVCRAQECARKVVGNIQQGYLLGQKLYAMRKNEESLYAGDEHQQEIQKLVDNYSRKKTELRVAFSNTPSRRKSYYDSLVRSHGPLGAELLLVLSVHAMDPFTESPVLLVREVAWTMEPGGYHKNLAAVMDELLSLDNADDVHILPQTSVCYPYSAVLPSADQAHAFARYMGSLAYDN